MPRYLLAFGALALLGSCDPVLLEGDLHNDLGFVYPGGSGPGGPACADGRRGLGETDVDCGGPLCSRCADGNQCAADSDCQSSRCVAGASGPPPRCISCSDGLENGDETDVDCGGSTCSRCPLGYQCRTDSDCAAGVCLVDLCVQPSPLRFDPVATYLVGIDFAGLALGDIDGDGILDVAASDPRAESLVVMRGRGDGSFWPPYSIALGRGAAPGALAAGDLDGDHHADLVAVDGTRLHVALAGGGSVRTVAWSQPATAVVLADFNGDGRLDAGVTGPDANAFGVLHGNGKGALMWAFDVPLGKGASQIAAGDIDGDNLPDAVLNWEMGPTQVLLSQRAGGMMPAGKFLFPKLNEGDYHYAALGVGRFDKDDLLDVVDTQGNTRAGTGRIQILSGVAGGMLQAKREVRDDVAAPDSLAVADFDHDGRADVAVSGGSDQGAEPDCRVQVFLGDGDGRLVPGYDKPVKSDDNKVLLLRLLHAGDLDGDGWADLVGVATTPEGDNAVLVLINATR